MLRWIMNHFPQMGVQPGLFQPEEAAREARVLPGSATGSAAMIPIRANAWAGAMRAAARRWWWTCQATALP
jgi:hypothetical protein